MLEHADTPSRSEAEWGVSSSAHVDTVEVIVPLRNESRHLPLLLAQLHDQTCQPEAIYLVVAPSDDNTLELALEASRRQKNVHVLRNHGGSAAEAMNLGLKALSADAWIRIDGHTEIPVDLVEKLRYELNARSVTCVGPLLDSGAQTDRQQAIGIAMASPLGVGGARFRTGAGQPGLTDAVAFGLYRTAATREVGLFNEEMIRNQDDEYNTRLRKNGGTIWLTHSVTVTYYPRASYRKLATQYQEYGYWRIIGTVQFDNQLRPRQLAPLALLVTVGAGLVAGAAARRPMLAALPLGIYGLVPGAQIIRSLSQRYNGKVSCQSAAAVVILHFSYGLGSVMATAHLVRTNPQALLNFRWFRSLGFMRGFRENRARQGRDL